MYADRYGAGPAIKPGSLTLALAATALPIAMIVVGLQIRQIAQPVTVLIGKSIKLDPPPPPDPRPIKPDTKKPIDQTVYAPIPQTAPPVDPVDLNLTNLKPETIPLDPPGKGIDLVPEVRTTPPPPPVMVGAEIDPRYRNLLQPPYPPEEIRGGNSGRVSLRVLVGADGRVKQVVRLSATSDAFYASAEKQALGKWRFKPATQDGVAIEQWKVMNLRFELSTVE